MHENANISLQAKESKKVIDTILSVQPRDSGSSGSVSPDQIVAQLCASLQERLPLLLIPSNEEEKKNEIDSLSVCLAQECERFNRLLQGMRASLANMQKALRGEVVMSAELDRM